MGDHRHSSVVVVFCPLLKAPSVFHLPTNAPSFFVGSSADCVAQRVLKMTKIKSSFAACIAFLTRFGIGRSDSKLRAVVAHTYNVPGHPTKESPCLAADRKSVV